MDKQRSYQQAHIFKATMVKVGMRVRPETSSPYQILLKSLKGEIYTKQLPILAILWAVSPHF